MTLLDVCNAETEAYAALTAAGGALEPDGVVAAGATNLALDLGYGVDLSCPNGDLMPDMSEIDPESPEAVSQALWNRINTLSGFLYPLGDDERYGYDIQSMLSADFTPLDIMAQQDLIAAECLKDDRVRTCSVALRQIEGGSFQLDIVGELVNGGVYSLVEKLTAGPQMLEDMSR
jgi:hypothetical protein